MISSYVSRASNPDPVQKTDWHCHILPGVDDGPTSIDESIAMARTLCESGFSTVYCTSHLIKGSFEADNETIKTILVTLRTRLEEENINLELLPGREYYMDEFLLDYLKEPMPLGNTKYILVEIPSHMESEYAKEICYRIRCSGYIPMIAHPERCKLFDFRRSSKNGLQKWFKVQRSKFRVLNQTSNTEHRTQNSLLDYLAELGCRFQGNLGSFLGHYGEAVRTNAENLMKKDLYICFGTDAHSKAGCSRKISFQIEQSSDSKCLRSTVCER